MTPDPMTVGFWRLVGVVIVVESLPFMATLFLNVPLAIIVIFSVLCGAISLGITLRWCEDWGIVP